MTAPLIRATWQSVLLSTVSNIFGQLIACSQKGVPLRLNLVELLRFVFFAALSCPPNFMWQAWLEKNFPRYTMRSANDIPSKGTSNTRQLSIRNTAIKFGLDQTIGAVGNTILFLGGMAILRGRSNAAIIQDCREQFWPLMMAGQKLWPAVSLSNFLFIPVAYRTTFASVAGLFWGIYLSLISSDAAS